MTGRCKPWREQGGVCRFAPKRRRLPHAWPISRARCVERVAHTRVRAAADEGRREGRRERRRRRRRERRLEWAAAPRERKSHDAGDGNEAEYDTAASRQKQRLPKALA